MTPSLGVTPMLTNQDLPPEPCRDEAVKLSACPPHSWAHAPTVGYFRCGKCGERIEHDDPRYADMIRARTLPPSPVQDDDVERVARAIADVGHIDLSLLIQDFGGILNGIKAEPEDTMTRRYPLAQARGVVAYAMAALSTRTADPNAMHWAEVLVDDIASAIAALTKPAALPKEGEELDAIAVDAADRWLKSAAGPAGERRGNSTAAVAGFITGFKAAALSSLPVSGEVERALRSMAEFPEDATWNLVLVEKGFNVEWRLVHWASGDGDGLMPAFRGLFVSDGYGFREFEPSGWTVLGWLPMAQPRQVRAALNPQPQEGE